MKLARLRLSGFKSFVEPTELVIEPGLTGVVGPNGCGKSNLLEALRWVMGETSAKAMRGGEMEDVIFAGTQTRPSRNHAEVVLVIDNAERRAPAHWNDAETIEISRRIEREMGSLFRINGREARMRDVQLFFADASTGAHSPALVRQGRIGELINAKPQARRMLLEEAAGISGLHSRRHEAELKLRAAEQNLARLADVIGEIEQQLANLKKQARQASRYRNLSGHIRTAESIAFHLRWREAADAVASAEQALAEASARVAAAAQDAARASTTQAEVQEALPPLREEEARRAAALQRLIHAREALDAEEARARAEAQRLSQRLAETGRDLARERGHAADAAHQAEHIAAEAAALAADAERERETEQAAHAAVSAAAEALKAGEQALDSATRESAELSARRQSLLRTLSDLEGRIRRLEGEAASTAAERERLEGEARVSEEARLASDAADAARTGLDSARTALASAEEARQAADSAERAARPPLAEAEATVQKLKAEAKAIADLLGKGVTDLFPPLIDAITAAPGYEAALAAALGDDLDAALDENAPAHWRALPPYADQQPLPEGVEPLGRFVVAPDALARRLAQIGVVAGEEGAALQPRLAPGQRLVSVEGALWRWDGFRVAEGAPTPAAQRLRQKNRLTELDGLIAEADARATAAREAYHTARIAAEQAGEREGLVRADTRAAERILAQAEDVLRRAEKAAAHQAQRLAAIAEAEARIAAQRNEADTALMSAREAVAALPAEEPVRERLSSARDEVARLRLAASETRARAEGLVRERQARERRREELARELLRWNERKASAELQIVSLGERMNALSAEHEAAEALPAQIAEQRSGLLSALSEAEAARRSAADRLAEGEQLMKEADRLAKETAAALASAREVRARAEATLDAQRTRLAETALRIRETMECEPGQLLERAGHDADAPLPLLADIEAKVERLKRERETLGGVNLRAEEEAEEHQKRLDSMLADRADLERAIEKLRGGIGELNREGRTRLVEAFDKVNANFKQLFRKLFGGGEAELTLTESDDPLEAGLEILARPPGKKLATMSLLSGGEQALTAMALIFGVFLVNPAPICVLDEVDAPLDDANTERFCVLLEEMTRLTDTRFLIITHHALTMARMDRLFGVTMQERGVSQLVSVDLAGAERVLAAE